MNSIDSPLQSCNPVSDAFGYGLFRTADQQWSPVPVNERQWFSQFADWLDHRWYSPGCGVPNPSLEPLVQQAEECQRFDLDDVNTWLHWVEFISEHPQRLTAWQGFTA